MKSNCSSVEKQVSSYESVFFPLSKLFQNMLQYLGCPEFVLVISLCFCCTLVNLVTA